MEWGIVVDSCSDLKLKDFKYDDINFDIIPLKIIIGDEEYVDDENIDVDAMIESMRNCKDAASSACPSPGDFMTAFNKSDQCICITMTGALSGTYSSAVIAQKMALEESSDKKIHIIDTHSAAGGLQLCVRKAAELIKSGADFETICAEMDKYVDEIKLVFCLGSYENLIKNGRMNSFVGAIATHLGIKAVAVNTPEGEIKISKKTRNEANAVKAMVEIMGNSGDLTDKPIMISHCKNLPMAEKCARLITEKLHTSDITISECKALTTFYAMPGGVLIGY